MFLENYSEILHVNYIFSILQALYSDFSFYKGTSHE